MSDSTLPTHRASESLFLEHRGLRHHIRRWQHRAGEGVRRAPLVMLHGWMDVGASFQFVVDAIQDLEGDTRCIVAPDWRGFGLSATVATDSYWHPDYLADLDGLLEALFPGEPVDLMGHSMGGNIAMVYAGVRPGRVRRLVNLEGFGLPQTRAAQAPGRLAQWLDELKRPARLATYDSLAGVAARLQANNPLLSAARADWLAPHWAQRQADGRWHLLADPAHKRVNPVLYQRDEAIECWKRIAAPVLWIEGDRTDLQALFKNTYPREEFEARLGAVAQLERRVLSPAGHMLHHDQPEALAREVIAFLR